MKKTIAAAAGMTVLMSCSHRPALPNTPGALESTRQELLRLNREIVEPMILDNNAGTFLAHAHEDFLVIAPGGVIENREQAADGARNFDATAVSLSDEQLRVVGDTAVLIGRLSIDGKVGPRGRPGPMRFMAVFVRQSGEWKLLARSLTPCAPLAVERGRC